jgi:lysophospholipase L1-like esterase
MPTNATISAATSGNPKQGCPDNFGVTFLNGITSCYLSLSKSGVEETTYARQLVGASFQWAQLIPQSYGSGVYTAVAYDAISGGNVIGTSDVFTVVQSTLPSLPLAADAVVQTIGDSTTAQYYSQTPSPGYDGMTTEMRWMAIYARLAGYPADFSIWPNYHNFAINSNERYAGGGAYYGVTGDTSSPNGTNPGFTTRIYSALVQRPKILFVQVTVNDILQGISTTTAIANYQQIANRATLAGCIVVFCMLRPGSSGTLNSGRQADRVTINNGVAAICGSVTGCYFWDMSPEYTLAIGGASAYNNANPILDQDLIITVHPTAQGAAKEAASLATRMTALNIFSSSNNYPVAIYTNAAAYFNYTSFPNFNGGNNAGVTLTNGASGTWLNGISAVSGGGSSATTVVGSTEANGGTGGNSQVLTITPGSTGAQTITTTMVGPTRSAPYTGYAGLVECMMEVEITTDTEALISAVSLNLEGDFGSPAMTLHYDGPGAMPATAGDTPPVPSTPQTWWLWGRTRVPLECTLIDYKLLIAVNATSKTAVAVVKIKRHYLRQYTADPRLTRMLPQAPTISVVGGSVGGSVPLRVEYAGSGVTSVGFRAYYKAKNSSAGFVYFGDFFPKPGVTGFNFNVTGLTGGTTYEFRIHSLNYGNELGGGNGAYYLESSPSNIITVAAVSGSGGIIQGSVIC